MVIGFGFLFNLMNAYLNGHYIFRLSNQYTSRWLTDPRFIGGLTLFVIGYLINRAADRILRNLRAPGETVYKIPQTGFYRWISCPNYFGRDCGLERLGFSYLVVARTGICGLDDCQSGAARPFKSQMVSEELSGLSCGTKSIIAEGMVGRESKSLEFSRL